MFGSNKQLAVSHPEKVEGCSIHGPCTGVRGHAMPFGLGVEELGFAIYWISHPTVEIQDFPRYLSVYYEQQ